MSAVSLQNLWEEYPRRKHADHKSTEPLNSNRIPFTIEQWRGFMERTCLSVTFLGAILLVDDSHPLPLESMRPKPTQTISWRTIIVFPQWFLRTGPQSAQHFIHSISCTSTVKTRAKCSFQYNHCLVPIIPPTGPLMAFLPSQASRLQIEEQKAFWWLSEPASRMMQAFRPSLRQAALCKYSERVTNCWRSLGCLPGFKFRVEGCHYKASISKLPVHSFKLKAASAYLERVHSFRVGGRQCGLSQNCKHTSSTRIMPWWIIKFDGSNRKHTVLMFFAGTAA